MVYILKKCKYWYLEKQPNQQLLYNSDLQHGLEFDYN